MRQGDESGGAGQLFTQNAILFMNMYIFIINRQLLLCYYAREDLATPTTPLVRALFDFVGFKLHNKHDMHIRCLLLLCIKKELLRMGWQLFDKIH